jgi:PAS domain S-box-containing protein
MTDELRILLLEDVSDDAELIKRELRKGNLDFTSRRVYTTKEYLQELQEFTPHIVISDFTLGELNALDALKLLKEHAPDLPFILVTGSQSEEVAVDCIKEGADDYILKSSLTRLPSAVLGALKKKEIERERARVETALRRSEEHFRSLIEHSSDVITIISRDGTISYESPALERMLGYKPEELIGQNAFQLIHPSDVPIVVNALAKPADPSVRHHPIEYRIRHRNGSWRVLETLGANLLDEPEVAGIIINSRDITERKQAEEQIREQAALLDKAQDAIMVFDLETRIGFWNKSAERLYGWLADEVIGLKVDDLLNKNDPTVAVAARQEALHSGEWIGELQQETKAGRKIVVESRLTLVSDVEGRPKSMLVINTDITEKKRLEAQFLRVQRMESIGTLAGGIAHDLNNVLTPILMAIRMLRDEVSSGSAQEILNTLEASAHRGSGIVQQVLSFARGVEGERATFQVKHPLSEVVAIAKDTFPRSIQISSRIEKDLWPIVGDPTQLHQVFLNLCVNARDAMPNGGRLQIEAKNSVVDENYAQMQPDAKAGPHVVITIADTGVGIPPALLDKVFEPFFTTKEVGKGTGLGLSTVLGIVKSHSGFLNVYSEVGKGTRFKVHLPAAEPSQSQPPAEEELDLPKGQGELILVADDEKAIRDIIRVTLEGNQYKVLTANDGTEAVAIYAQHGSEIKAVMVDIMMPYMDGSATVRALQKMNPDIKCMAVSGLMENDKVAEMSETGRISFLAKPFTTEQLLVSLRELLDPGSGVGQEDFVRSRIPQDQRGPEQVIEGHRAGAASSQVGHSTTS